MSDFIKIACPSCEQRYKFTSDQWVRLAGKTVKCRKCGNTFAFPDAEEPAQDYQDAVAPAGILAGGEQALRSEKSAEGEGDSGGATSDYSQTAVAEPPPSHTPFSGDEPITEPVTEGPVTDQSVSDEPAGDEPADDEAAGEAPRAFEPSEPVQEVAESSFKREAPAQSRHQLLGRSARPTQPEAHTEPDNESETESPASDVAAQTEFNPVTSEVTEPAAINDFPVSEAAQPAAVTAEYAPAVFAPGMIPTAMIPTAMAPVAMAAAPSRPAPDYVPIKTGARLLGTFASLAWVVSAMGIAVALLFVVLALMTAMSNPVAADGSSLLTPHQRWVASIPHWTAAIILFIGAFSFMITAALLQLIASLSLAVRDLARNSFRNRL